MLLGGDLDIRQFEFPSSQDDDSGYFRRGEHRCEVGTAISERVRGRKSGWWSGIGFVGVGLRKTER